MQVILTLIAVLLASQVAVDQELLLRTMRSDDGTELRVAITRQQAENVPSWDPEEKQVLPLSMEMAIGLARDSIRNRHSSISEFRVAAIEIDRLHSAFQDRWYYIINFRPVIEGRSLIGGLYASFVLMDGTVVEPQVRKDDP
jgi:hypothetical protein